MRNLYFGGGGVGGWVGGGGYIVGGVILLGRWGARSHSFEVKIKIGTTNLIYFIDI